MVERSGENVYKTEEIKPVRQRGSRGCGYAMLSMQLTHLGYDATPETVFEKIHGKPFDKNREIGSLHDSPTISHLAWAAQEITNGEVTPRIFNKERFEELQEKRPKANLSPENVLLGYIKRDVPCGVRQPGHYVLTTGVNLDSKEEKYTYNEPFSGTEMTSSEETFNRLWGQADEKYPGDYGKNLMLVLERKKD